LQKEFKALKSEGFLPLSKSDYTWKYRIARIVINIFV